VIFEMIRLALVLIISLFVGSNGVAQKLPPKPNTVFTFSDVAEWGHSYIAVETGEKWHSVKTCWSLQRSHPQAIRYLLHLETLKMGGGKKWNSHCKICREALRLAVLEKQYKNEAEKKRLIAFSEAEQEPPPKPPNLGESTTEVKVTNIETKLSESPKTVPGTTAEQGGDLLQVQDHKEFEPALKKKTMCYSQSQNSCWARLSRRYQSACCPTGNFRSRHAFYRQE
jgi:hypothetical protein